MIERQADLLGQAVSKFVGRGQGYALIDFPDYPNVGDSAIWLGASRLLKEATGQPPQFVCTHQNYDPGELARSCPAGPIFILGGGNFGDLYIGHQALRYSLMRDFPQRSIVQLPQSIHFTERKHVERTARAISAHGKFHLLVRDRASEAFAKGNFDCPVTIAPDCAFALGPLRRPTPPQFPFLCLFRSDKERTGIDYSALDVLEAPVRDWLEESNLPKFRGAQSIAGLALRGRLSPQGVRRARYNASATLRIRRGLNILSLGEVVVTDRLHGHILSIMLGIPDVAFDNSTKKVSGYHQLWLKDLRTAAAVDTADAALSALQSVREAGASEGLTYECEPFWRDIASGRNRDAGLTDVQEGGRDA